MKALMQNPKLDRQRWLGDRTVKMQKTCLRHNKNNKNNKNSKNNKNNKNTKNKSIKNNKSIKKDHVRTLLELHEAKIVLHYQTFLFQFRCEYLLCCLDPGIHRII